MQHDAQFAVEARTIFRDSRFRIRYEVHVTLAAAR